MATIYYPTGTTPYQGSCYISGEEYEGAVVNSNKLWINGSSSDSKYARARLKVDYTITGTTATAKVTLQYCRINGDHKTRATIEVFFDNKSIGKTGVLCISEDCPQRDDNEGNIVPNYYFTDILSKTYTLTADSNGNFKQNIAISADGSNNNTTLKRQTTTISFGGGWTNVTPGSVSISDNSDNSFKVIVTPGKAGTNNAVVKEFLNIEVNPGSHHTGILLKQTSLNNYNRYENGSYSCKIAFNSLSDYVVDRDKDDFVPNNRNVSVELVTIGAQGDEVSFYKNFTGTDAPRQYTPPTDPGTPSITYNKNRPTKNATYTYTWEQAESRNQNSPVEGYRVRLYKYTSLTQDQNEGTVIQGLEIDSDGFLQQSAGTNNFIDWELTEDEAKKDKLSIKLIPQNLGLKHGDVIRLNLYAYVRRGGDGSPRYPNEHNSVNNGWNDTDFSGGGKYEANSKYYTGGIYSPSVTLQRAGTMHVKTANGWKEGQVFVKTNSGWVEADSVYVKTAGGWKESE